MRVTLKAARVNKELTQEAFAKAVGVGAKTVANWENGVSSPRADKLPEICRVLGCETDDLIFLSANCG